MRVMAVGTQQVLLLSVPRTGPSAVNAFFPIPQFGPMTLTTELVGFLERNQFSAGRVEHISVFGVMAVHTPTVFFIVFEDDIIMEFFQFTAFEVDLHILMTHGARIIVLA
jgi:hypothetical protein